MTAAGRAPALAGRALLAAVLAAAGLAAWADGRSRLAERLRSERPLRGLALLRAAGQSPIVAPALYLAVYGPRAGTAELVLLPPETPVAQEQTPGDGHATLADAYASAYAESSDARAAARAMAEAALDLLRRQAAWSREADADFLVDLELPAELRPAYPHELLERLLSARADPFFWLRFPRAARRLLADERTGLGRYDACLLAREAGRLSTTRVTLSRLPPPALWESFLGRVFGRAAGLPEPAGEITVEVYNASETERLALRATKILRFDGFDVVHFGNAATLEPSVRATDRAGTPSTARAVLRALGCPQERVFTAMEQSPDAAVTIVLGRDYRRCRKLSAAGAARER